MKPSNDDPAGAGAAEERPRSRYRSVDEFRGFAVISMIIVNYLAYYHSVPAFLKHAKGTGLTFADLVAPFFLFILGTMYRKSLLLRVSRDGRFRAYAHSLRRYFFLILIGLAGGCVGKMRITFDWGVLQAIGLSGIIALPFIALGAPARLTAAAAMLFAYWTAPFRIHELISATEQGGPFAAVAWAGLIVLATVAGDLLGPQGLGRSARGLALFSLAALSAGAAITLFIPLSKEAVSPSFIVLSTGISGLAFLLFLGVSDWQGFSIPTLEPLGKNALLIFWVHYVLVRVGFKAVPRESSLLSVLIATFLIYFVCVMLTWYLDRKRLYLKL